MTQLLHTGRQIALRRKSPKFRAGGDAGSSERYSSNCRCELGGSNDIANLFPEKRDVSPGYKVKDKLENKLHDLVCDGTFTLRSVRQRTASNWRKLYKDVFGVAPSG